MFFSLHCTAMFAICGFSLFLHFSGSTSSAVSDKCLPESILDAPNRDEIKPSFPLKEDPRLKTSNILNAHKIIRKGLQQFLEFREENLSFYLSHIVENKPAFKDEYGVEIRLYFKVFKFIWKQYNETICQNYAIKQFENDKLDLCSIARFLSHQIAVKDRDTIMKRMGDALGYRCHPCTPYRRKQYGQTFAPNTDNISPEGVSLEERLIICKEYDHDGNFFRYLSTEPSSSTSSSSTISFTAQAPRITTAVELIEPGDSPSKTDYSPCSHSDGDVVCDQISLEDVRRVFNRTSFPRLASVELILQPHILNETFIPEDVFGGKRVLRIEIGFPSETFITTSLSWEVNPNAFRSTKSFTKQFIIGYIDCTLFDLGFLSEFDKLVSLKFVDIFNIQHCLPSLPALPRLTQLSFEQCEGMRQLDIFPNLINGLKNFRFWGDDDSRKSYSVETVDEILDWLLISSASTLEELTIASMKHSLSRVPRKISSFKTLRKLFLNDNNISVIKSGAFSFSVPVSTLDIHGNSISKIEPGAFQGDFKYAWVLVWNNNLTRFEESVFGPILQQIASGKGFISAINKNFIDCREESICHLAWLRRYSIDSDFTLECSNGTSFADLRPEGFNHCT